MRLLDDSQITTQISTWDSGGTYDVRGDLNPAIWDLSLLFPPDANASPVDISCSCNN